MKTTPNLILMALLLLGISACKNNEPDYDASGTFEATETIVSSQGTGELLVFNVDEGDQLTAGQVVGQIDSVQLYLKRKQVNAQIDAILAQMPDIPVQLAALYEQLKKAETEQERITRLVSANAATTKQLDDINAQIAVLHKQIEAMRSTLELSSTGIKKQVTPLQVQLEQLDDQLSKCHIVNPVTGTVLVTYAEAHEVTAAGKPLYKIADLSEMKLTIYITGDQLPQVKLGQELHVFTDNGSGGYTETTGTISWISDKAEFTPKTIQTKNERANKVYAVKVKVKNDGTYKIGMYGEVKF